MVSSGESSIPESTNGMVVAVEVAGAVVVAVAVAVASGAIPVVVGAVPAEVAVCTIGGPSPGGGSGGAMPGGGAGLLDVDVAAPVDDGVDTEANAEVDVVREIGFFLGEAWVLEGGFVDWVESDDFPRDIAVAVVDFFLSDLADPIGNTEGEGNGNAELLALGLRETMFPILSDLGPPLIVLAGRVLTVMFFPHPAELGRADAERSATSTCIKRKEMER